MQKIKTEVLINAGVEKVWSDYTDPESIKGWAFASDDWECPHAESDLKIGGRFLTRMSAKDKSFGFDFTGTYTEVQEYKKIAYVMDKAPNETASRECEVTFEDLGANQTKVVVIFDSEDENPIEMQKNGWQSILNNFKKFIENN
ncbi:MAG: SRPBCC domain-containing protein [Minisyncoccia bacterium]